MKRILLVLLISFCNIKSIAQLPYICLADSYEGYNLDSLCFTVHCRDGNSIPFLFWDRGKSVKISFLSGSKLLQKKIVEVAKEWEKYANIQLDFGEFQETDVRILLNNGGFINSSIGVLSNIIPQNAPSMIIDTTLFVTKGKLKSIVSHLFGHVLGLVHEQKFPIDFNSWKFKRIYDYFDKINFHKLNIKTWFFEQQFSFNDVTQVSNSIMNSPLPKHWTNNSNVLLTADITKKDIELISKCYPKEDTFYEDDRGEVIIPKFVNLSFLKTAQGLVLLPEFDLIVKEEYAPVIFMVLFYDELGIPIVNDGAKYNLNNQLSAIRSKVVSPGTYFINKKNFWLVVPLEKKLRFLKKKVQVEFRVVAPKRGDEKVNWKYISKKYTINLE